MRYIPVQSSHLAAVGYNEGSRTLVIEFLSGDIYHYFDVPVHIYEGLMTAESHGVYFGAYIRDEYRYRKLN